MSPMIARPTVCLPSPAAVAAPVPSFPAPPPVSLPPPPPPAPPPRQPSPLDDRPPVLVSEQKEETKEEEVLEVDEMKEETIDEEREEKREPVSPVASGAQSPAPILQIQTSPEDGHDVKVRDRSDTESEMHLPGGLPILSVCHPSPVDPSHP